MHLNSHYKNKLVSERAKFMHSFAFILMQEMIGWFKNRGVLIIITDTVSTDEEDVALGRISSSHREGRAFDIRTTDVPEVELQKAIKHFTELYGHLGAISILNGKRNLIVDKSKTRQPHLHVQLDKTYAVKIDIPTL